MTSGANPKKTSQEAAQKRSESVKNTKNSNVKNSAVKNTEKPKSREDHELSEEQKRLGDEVRFFLALGVTALVTMCNFHLCLDVGEIVYSVLHGFFGCLAYILPFVLLWAYLFMIPNQGSVEAGTKMRLCLVLFVLFCGLVHLIGIKETQSFSLVYYFTAGQSGINGGLIGGLIAGSLQHLVGTVATILIIVLLMLITVIILTERSAVRTIQKNAAVLKKVLQERSDGLRDFLEGFIPSDSDEEYEEYDDLNEEYDASDDFDGDDEGTERFEWKRSSWPEWRNTRSDFFNQQFPFSEDMEKEQNPASWLQDSAQKGSDDLISAQKEPEEQKTTYSAKTRRNAPLEGSRKTASFKEGQRMREAQKRSSYGKEQGRVRHVKNGSTHAASASGRPGTGTNRVMLERDTHSLEEMGFKELLEETSPVTGSIDDFIVYNGLLQQSLLLQRPDNAQETPFVSENACVPENIEVPESASMPGTPFVSENGYVPGNAEVPESTETPESASMSESGAMPEGAYTSESGAMPEGAYTSESGAMSEGAYTPESGAMSEGAYTSESGAMPESAYTSNTAAVPKSGYVPETAAAVDLTEHVRLPEDGPVIRTGAENHKKQSASAAGGGSIWKQQSDSFNRGSSGAGTFGGRPRPQEKKPVVKKPYVFPPSSLLKRNTAFNSGVGPAQESIKNKLHETLQSFGVGVNMGKVSVGPSVTRYELEPESGVKVSRIVALQDDIKLALAASDIRIEAPIPGKSAIGIEVPNRDNSVVGFRELIESNEFKFHSSRLAVAVGRNISGQITIADLAKMPHLLIAGATGSGKSVCINTLIMSIIYKATPEQVKLIMVDPKVVELSVYNGIPHLLVPVVTDPRKAANALRWAVDEMNDRYKKFAEHNVRNLEGYNEHLKKLKEQDPANEEPYLYQMVIIVDELADLMMVAPGEVEEAICRLAQMARAAGIHLVLATQRPSVNVITGLIKANVPSRIAFAVSSGVDSRTIIDMNGAEKLLGKGDMLFYPYGIPKPVRVQGAFISDEEVSRVVSYLQKHNGELSGQEMMEQMITSASEGASMKTEQDEYFERAARFIIEKDKASIGALQRNFKIGFNRAARIMDQLASAGVVGEEDGTKPRKILMSMEELDQFLAN